MRFHHKLLVGLGVLGLTAGALSLRTAQATGTPAVNVESGEYTGERAPVFPHAFYDMNVTSPQTMRDFLWVIDSTYDLLLSQGAAPQRIKFVVSLRGLSVAFATTTFGAGDPVNGPLGVEIRQYLSKLADKGVRIEACEISCNWVGVDLSTLDANVLLIDNAFASSIWYQSRGYALIPIHQLPS